MSPERSRERRHDIWPFGWLGSPWFVLGAMTLVCGRAAIGWLQSDHPWVALGPGLILLGTWWLHAPRFRGVPFYEVMSRPRIAVPSAVLIVAPLPLLVAIWLATGEDDYRRGAIDSIAWALAGLLPLLFFAHPKLRPRLQEGVERERDRAAERQRQWESDQEWEQRLRRRFPEQ